MVYTSASPPLPETREELRARIPGWGVDADVADRPSGTRLLVSPELEEQPTAVPEQQPERWPRERSIEHARLTPVFGTSCPPRWLSGAARRFAYERYSEGRAAHWLLLVAADRIDAVEHHLESFLTLRPDNPVTQTGIKAELTHDGLGSRRDRHRADVKHQAMDPLIVAGPWLLVGWYLLKGVRRLRR